MATAVERVDPPGRTLTGAHAARVKNQRPDREYICGNPHDDLLGCDALENDGWKYIVSGSDKETMTGAKVIDSNRLAWRGQVLMWRPKAEQQEYLDQKHSFMAQHEAAKKTPGGIDGVKSFDGTPAQNIISKE